MHTLNVYIHSLPVDWSLLDFASDVFSRCVTAASTTSSHPCKAHIHTQQERDRGGSEWSEREEGREGEREGEREGGREGGRERGREGGRGGGREGGREEGGGRCRDTDGWAEREIEMEIEG